MALTSINPATGQTVKTYPELSEADVRGRLKAAETAWVGWARMTVAQRAPLIQAVAKLLRARLEPYAALMAREMGKPLAQGRSELEKCASVCDYYAEHAQQFLSPEQIPTEALRSYVAFQPLGVVLAVMPWNFPFWQVFRAAVPALLAGNTMVLKHASNVPSCELAIEEVFRDAGAPPGVFQTLLVSVQQVTAIIQHPAIRAVTLTGSTPAGQSVAAAAGAVLKKTVLELGGSDPYIILEDADLDLAAESCATSRLINGGQSCIAAKRFIVVESIRQPFEERMVVRMRAQRMGDPFEAGVTIGPMARRDLRDALHAQVQASVAKGARLLLGGVVPPGEGAYYPPTVLSGVRKGMPAYDEETFGPVAAIISAADEVAAIAIANDSPFGLGAAIFTRDQARGERLAAEQLQAGSCFVNVHVRSDPRLPFGGIKQSGYGRELSSFGIREFVNIKTVYVK